MKKYIMLVVWVFLSLLFVKGFFSGLSEVNHDKISMSNQFHEVVGAGQVDSEAATNDMSRLVYWYILAVIINIFVYLIFTKSVLKEFGYYDEFKKSRNIEA